jgi:uncharacterized protein YaaW (UPF0174 family)
MGQTELMEEMGPTQRMFPLHLRLQGLQDHKVNVVREVSMELLDQAVQQVQLVLQEQVVLLDQQVQQGLQVAVQLEHKVRQVPMERMELMAVQVVPV